MPSREKLDLLFHCLTCHANWSPTPVFITDILSSVLKPIHPFIHSPLTQTTVSILNLHSSVDFRRFHTLWPQKTNNASLLLHGASWQWSGHVVRPTAQAQTAWSSRPLYDILLRSHFVSRNKIFRCAYFSMHFRIAFLLFNYFPSYIQFSRCVVCFEVTQYTSYGSAALDSLDSTVSVLLSCGLLTLWRRNLVALRLFRGLTARPL